MAPPNETSRHPAWIVSALYLFVVVVLLLNVINQVRYLWRGGLNLGNLFSVAVAVALLALGYLARAQATTRS